MAYSSCSAESATIKASTVPQGGQRTSQMCVLSRCRIVPLRAMCSCALMPQYIRSAPDEGEKVSKKAKR